MLAMFQLIHSPMSIIFQLVLCDITECLRDTVSAECSLYILAKHSVSGPKAKCTDSHWTCNQGCQDHVKILTQRSPNTSPKVATKSKL